MTGALPVDAVQRAPRRVLIVGMNYWPEETGNAPYTTGLAEHLSRRGARVTVIAGMPYYPSWRVDDGYRLRWRLREQRNGVDIHRFRQYVPGRQSAARRAMFEATFLAHAATVRGLDAPDLVLGVLPTLSDGVLAMTLAHRYRVPYALVVQDLVGQSAAQSGIAGGGRVARTTMAIEGRVARGAARVAIVSDGFRPYLQGLGVDPARIELLPNWSHVVPSQRSRSDVRAELGWADGEHIVLHAGNMGLKQGLENLVNAARLAAELAPDHRFVLMGDGNQRARLQALAAGLPNLDFLPPQPADRFMDVLAASDVLLVNERGTVVDMSLPSKLTSYFVAGRPVVAAVSPAGVTAREIARSAAGLTVPGDDPPALVAILDRLRADPALGAQLGAAGTAYAAAHLAPEPVLARAESFVETIVANRRGRISDLRDRPVGPLGVEIT
ncbi:MAG: colanic acid biosynthesis glycosyl transferase WcaI [Thermomicrobiales bacterium]|nr:colanic acid biosynthesis glycosyl transferase WcaI [Thermomicrobiales bacterium]